MPGRHGPSHASTGSPLPAWSRPGSGSSLRFAGKIPFSKEVSALWLAAPGRPCPRKGSTAPLQRSQLLKFRRRQMKGFSFHHHDQRFLKPPSLCSLL